MIRCGSLAAVVELADTHDSKSCGSNLMSVRLRPAAPDWKLFSCGTIKVYNKLIINKYMNKNEMPVVGEDKKFGVLGYRIENNHYVVNIRWKDGHETEEHFPVK